jgi:hypothetical protein
MCWRGEFQCHLFATEVMVRQIGKAHLHNDLGESFLLGMTRIRGGVMRENMRKSRRRRKESHGTSPAGFLETID